MSDGIRDGAMAPFPGQAERAEDQPRGEWSFDEKVVAAFDEMLARSIPSYQQMRRATTDAACWFVDAQKGTANRPRVVDLGCSNGAALQPIVDRVGVRARYTGLDASEPMLAAAQERFKGWEKIVGISKWDLRDGLPPGLPPTTAVLSILTLQFVPIEYRMRLLGAVWENLVYGGGLILVEKVLGSSPEIDALELDLYYELKRGNGYEQDAIDRKRLALEGRLVPLTAEANEEFLRGAGFRDVDVFWAWMNFRGWLAVKR